MDMRIFGKVSNLSNLVHNPFVTVIPVVSTSLYALNNVKLPYNTNENFPCP